MIEEPPLLTVKRPARRPTQAQIDAFQDVPTSFVVDAMYGDGALSPSIKPLGDGLDIRCVAAGPALTVDTGPGDIKALLGALTLIQPGDIVISTFHDLQTRAAAGDRVSTMMKNCGAAGFVTDGPMRDYAGLIDVDLPCWCTGLSPNSPVNTGPGKIGLPIQIGGREVETGDMIVGDRDGVVVVPFEQIDAVLAMLVKVTELETALDAELSSGLNIPQGVIDMMDSGDVVFVD